MPFDHSESSGKTGSKPLKRSPIEEAKRISALAFDAVSEGVVITDSDQLVVLVNPAFETITGYSLQELMGCSCSRLQGPLTDRQTIAEINQALHQQSPISGEILNYRKDGSTYWNDLTISPLLDNDGNLTHFIGFMRDITERKRSVAALQEAELRYRVAAEAAGGFILDMDLDFRYTFVSEPTEQLLGYSAHELIGHTPAEFMPPGELETVNAWFKKNHQPGQPVRGLEHRMLTKSGTEVWLQVSRIPLKGSDGETIGHRGTAFDITPRKLAEVARAELEAQMREAQKMEAIGTLAGGIAHDFNGIIAAILGNVNLAREDVGPSSPALESLDEIHKAASRARDLVRQILSFSRRQQTQYQPTDLGPIVDDTARMLRAILPARLTIDAHCQQPTPEVVADASQIQQVIINLATNAMQAMGGQPGHIRIRLDTVQVNSALLTRHPALRALHQRQPGDLARLSVSDNGPGMDAATAGRIFEPFFTTKPVGEGTGLGLAVVHGIAQGHSGVIVVDSQVGLGTQFTLYFPRALSASNNPSQEALASDELAQATQSSASPALVSTEPHIVYVDDDDALVSLVKRLLERRGYQVSAYLNQRSALNAIGSNPASVDLFLTDYNMPGMSGLELAAQVRKMRPDLPIAIVSAFIDETLSSQAASAGIQGVLFKATSVDEFCRAIEALLSPPD